MAFHSRPYWDEAFETNQLNWPADDEMDVEETPHPVLVWLRTYFPGWTEVEEDWAAAYEMDSLEYLQTYWPLVVLNAVRVTGVDV